MGIGEEGHAISNLNGKCTMLTYISCFQIDASHETSKMKIA